MQKTFKLNTSIIEQHTYSLWPVFFDLQERNITNDFEKRSGLIQTCNYAIEDAQSAIDSYKELSVSTFKNIPYLAVYGLFQAFFIQQDAFATLFKNFLNKKIVFKTDYPALYTIRNIRNITTGHPTDRGNEYFLISQIELKKDKYYLVKHNSRDEKKGMNIEVFPKLFYDQENGVIDLFNRFKWELNKLKKLNRVTET